MRWVAPTEKDTANETLEKRLWAAADQFRANSGLKAAQYSAPVLGLIFLRFAEARFAKRRAQLEKTGASPRRGNSRIDDPKAYMAEGVLYLTPSARFDYLLQRPEGNCEQLVGGSDAHANRRCGLDKAGSLVTNAFGRDISRRGSKPVD
jgi:type I restriction enzyme M protein